MLKTLNFCVIIIVYHSILMKNVKYREVKTRGGKPMDCALWLNRRKICSATEIAEEPDIASLRGYFLAGSLVGWLYEHGGKRYAKRLEKLSPNDPELNEKLAKIFGGSVGAHKGFGEGEPQTVGTALSQSSALPYGLTSASGSFEFRSAGSYNYSEISSFGSFLRGWEYFLGSFLSGSYSFGSGMHEWEWEWFFALYRSGSFTLGSFTSFHEWEWEWLFRAIRSGSFSVGSFGSFNFGSFWRFGNLGYFGSYGSWSSFIMPFPKSLDLLDEYDRIMFETLMRCPLDRFGYGIHNI